jgi:hypothetical protein
MTIGFDPVRSKGMELNPRRPTQNLTKIKFDCSSSASSLHIRHETMCLTSGNFHRPEKFRKPEKGFVTISGNLMLCHSAPALGEISPSDSVFFSASGTPTILCLCHQAISSAKQDYPFQPFHEPGICHVMFMRRADWGDMPGVFCEFRFS